MQNTILLGGVNRPVIFGNLAFRQLKNEFSLTIGGLLTQVGEADMTSFPELLYCGLRSAELIKNLPIGDYTVQQVAVWMDENEDINRTIIPWFMSAVENVSGQPKTVGEGETDEKKRKTKMAISTGQA